MKELVIISGKGGTGKTSIVAACAALAESAVLADCDVDAADLHLVLAPATIRRESFSGGSRARTIADRCAACGKCEEVCRFDAVSLDGPGNNGVEKTFRIDPIACEGCGVCAWFCPTEAIEFGPAVNGEWFVSETRCGPLVHARLGIAEANSGKLVSIVRTQARRIAQEQGLDWVLIDGSPGIGCPVIASITGADFVLVVTEPTLSGLHDLERVAELIDHFKVPAAVCINKCDLNWEMSETIRKFCDDRALRVVGWIPYDDAVTQAQLAGQSVVEYADGSAAVAIRSMWREIYHIINKGTDDGESECVHEPAKRGFRS